MPLYEYQCKKCGRRWERIQKFSDAPLTACEACSGELEQLLSAPAIQFKGSGWYVTDYARKASDSGGSSAGSPAASSETKTSEKSAEKTKEKESSKPVEPAKA